MTYFFYIKCLKNVFVRGNSYFKGYPKNILIKPNNIQIVVSEILVTTSIIGPQCVPIVKSLILLNCEKDIFVFVVHNISPKIQSDQTLFGWYVVIRVT